MIKTLTLSLAVGLILASGPAKATTQDADSAIQAPRLVPLEGVQNFRDIGGYRTVDGRRVKWGLIYRSAEMSDLSPADLAAVQALDIRAIHDLRSVEERRSDPTAWTGPDAPPITAHDYTMDLSGFAALTQGPLDAERAKAVFAAAYPQMLVQQRAQQRALFDDLLEADGGAVLYHCTAGKDRTGLATALILSALGVPRETIFHDYELSNRFFGRVKSATDHDDPAMAAFASLPPEVAAVFMGVDADYLRTVFAEIDTRYGSVEAYLDQELGVDAAEVQRLRTLYTE